MALFPKISKSGKKKHTFQAGKVNFVKVKNKVKK